MKKFVTKKLFRALKIRNNVCARLTEKRGSYLTEHGVMIVVCIVLALVVLGWATGFIQNTFLPKAGNKVTGFLN